ncbi:MAG TPA: hypothetical protein VHB77_10475 [Planctomycetaceae bacterium]|nr:hypothetical protein [Planctomycetaceae bacterium]
MSGKAVLGLGVLLAVLCVPQVTQARGYSSMIRRYQQMQQGMMKAQQQMMINEYKAEQQAIAAEQARKRAIGAARAHRKIVPKHLNSKGGTSGSKSLKSSGSEKKSLKSDKSK